MSFVVLWVVDLNSDDATVWSVALYVVKGESRLTLSAGARRGEEEVKSNVTAVGTVQLLD